MPANNGGMAVWSKAANNNSGADSTVGFQEGQAPSSLNDGCRALMASAARWRDDVSGALVTTGTSAAYQISSNQNFVNLTDLANQIVAFTPHVTNAAGPVTMTVDGFANLPLRPAPNKELPAGVLIQGTPYVALYNNTDGALYLQGFYGASPYLVPLGGMIDFIGLTAPNSQFALPFGQAINRTTYATLFAMVGTTYGTGDGSTTFNIPDLRGRVVAGKGDMGGTDVALLTASYFGANGATLGAKGGAESQALTTAQLPPHSHSNTLTDPGHPHGGVARNNNNTSGQYQFASGPTNAYFGDYGGSTATATTGITINNASAGSGNAHNNVQPTIVLSKILRII